MVSDELNVLLVEDDEIDAEAMLRALKRKQPKPRCTVVADGVDALDYLRACNSTKLSRTIILLDLNLSRMNGIEFLSHLRADPDLRRHIVFVLTTSDRREDKIAAYDRHIAGYCVKGRNMDGYQHVVDLLHNYKRTVMFPPV